MIEFSVRTAGNDVFGIKSNLVINTEGRGRGSVSVGVLLVSELCPCHLGSKVVGYVLKVLNNRSSRLSLIPGRESSWLDRVKGLVGVIIEVSEERRYSRCF